MTRATTISSSVETISPAIATAMLKRNVGNRNLRQGHIRGLADAMIDGRWVVAQAIYFDRDNNLIDGQHRLSAVVMSGVTVQMLVVRGVNKADFGAFDQGVLRTAGDIYGQLGGADVNNCTAIASAMMLRAAAQVPMSRVSVAEFALANRTVIEHVIQVTRPLKYMKSAERAAFANAIKFYGREFVDPPMERLAKNLFASPSDPMNTLNKWMIDKHARRANRKATTPRNVCYSAAVLAINAAVDDRPLTLLKPNGQDFK